MKNYVLGIDLGIGSVGWGLIDADKENAKIIDFGVRLFDSGEKNNGKNRKSQERRGFRGVRRLVRRRHFRKEMLKRHLQAINFVFPEEIQAYYETSPQNIYELRTLALDKKIERCELAAVLIHICNHRGYKEFYETDDTNQLSEDMKKETAEDKTGVDAFKHLMKSKGYRTVGEMFYTDEMFSSSIRNRETKPERILPTRSAVEKEAKMILNKQAEFHKELSPINIDRTLAIIFSQRDFENGPGECNEGQNKYFGFLESIGTCTFCDNKRGFRGTVIADLYAACNALSQYTYVDKSTGEIILKKELAYEILKFLLDNAKLTKTDLKKICRRHDTDVIIKDSAKDSTLKKSIKFLPEIKKLLEKENLDWNDFISEEQLDLTKPSRLHILGEVLSKYQTPKRKQKELKKVDWVSDSLAKAAMAYKFSGTTNVCYKDMIDGINGFLNGDIIGNINANKIKSLSVTKDDQKSYKLPVLRDENVVKNPVVFRTINEARKVINNIIEKYGTPSAINIEVASEVSRSYEERQKINKLQAQNEKENDRLTEKIKELYRVQSVTPVMLDRFKLYLEQEGKCLYSGVTIDEKRLFDAVYEIDHIVPYSLILDNSLHNKALVISTENQLKRQRTPLQYMNPKKAEGFVAVVNERFRNKKISERKYAYLTLPDIYSPECTDLLKTWKSRNINDTRYITKYIIRYITDNLKSDDKIKINGIKGAHTARFRKLWLDGSIWGDKDREASNLHHAVDAVVLANLTPEYLEIASDSMKLYQIFKATGKVVTDEYKEYLQKAIDKMKKIYGFSEEYTRYLLTKKGRVSPVIPKIKEEIDIRFNDKDEDLFKSQIRSFYGDEKFVENIRMPLVSYKQNKKLQGEITAANPLKIREIDSELWKVSRISIKDITSKTLDKIYSNDKDLIESIGEILSGKSEKYTIGDYLKENNTERFVTRKGTIVHKITVKEKTIEKPFYKEISENNKTALDANKYFCVEVFEDVNGKTQTRGIRRVDVQVKGKKLWLVCDYPEGYKKHIMYMHPYDYIVIKNKNGKIKKKGFYRGVFNINQNRFSFSFDNKVFNGRTDNANIAKDDIVEKYYVDILGNIGGKIKCGEPLSLLKEKK
jgi:CRISPR-associated endonuclease Csn1